MPQYLAVARLAKKSGIPEDAVENTFAFARNTILDADGMDSLTGAISDFYNTHPGTETAAVSDYLAPCLSVASNAASISFYDITGALDGSPHGAPMDVRHFTLQGTGSDGLPNELAACLSLHADYGSDVEFGAGAVRPRARDRGRIFLGPLAAAALVSDSTTKEQYIGATARTIFTEAARALIQTNGGGTWSVWSRKDATLKPIAGGWVDDAFDVQRRRGNAAQLRTIFVEPPP